MIGNYSFDTVINYLSKSKYYIPDYQRDYSWEEKTEIKELWEDILTVYDENIKDFFMGQIVLHKTKDDTNYIIDGQQRTITLTLLFIAFRENFIKLSSEENDTASRQVQKINANLGLIDKDDHEEKLILGTDDNTFFPMKYYMGA